jgi:uncharacterized membrane protein YcaP (DUF421 family)
VIFMLWDLFLRTVLAFILIMIITRFLGKTTVAQMTFHDFVAAITLGSLTANLAFNLNMSFLQLTVSLLTFSGVAYLLMVLSLKNRTLRKWFSGQPTVLIENGKILEQNMRKLKFTLDTLNQELREKNIFNIEEVQYAVLEPRKVSVLRKPEYLPVTRKDLNLHSNEKQSFPIELIMDGKIIDENLRQNGIDKEWLLSQAKAKGLSVEDIHYAVKSSNGKLFFDAYNDRLNHVIDKE